MVLYPKRPFTWLLLGVAIYAYAEHYKVKKQVAHNNSKYENIENKNHDLISPESISITTDKKEVGVSNKAANYIVKELSKTPTGQAFIKALAEQKTAETFKDKDPSLVTAFQEDKLIIVDKLLGKGDYAICGSTVKANFNTISKFNIELNDTVKENTPVTFTIGEEQVLKGIENGIIGMKKGGIRKVAIPPHMAYADPNFQNTLIGQDYAVSSDIELLDVKNGQYLSSKTKTTNVYQGKGIKTVLCDSIVSVKYQVGTDVSGIFSFSPIEKKIPFGIEQGILGMKVGEKRTLEIPYELLELEKGYTLKDVKFEEGKPLVLNVEVISIKE